MATDISNVPAGWVIVPAPWPVNSPPTPDEQKWILTLSGLADINFTSDSTARWKTEVFNLHLDWKPPVHFAYNKHVNEDESIYFQVEQWAQFCTLNSIYDAHASIDAGYAVNSWDIILTQHLDDPTKRTYGNLYEGISVDVAARDTDAFLYKVGFQTTLLGKIVKLKEVFY